jgi:hypothetical protein
MEHLMLTLSPLAHTWLLDLDGVIVKHNGYKLDGRDTLLDGAMKFLRSISSGLDAAVAMNVIRDGAVNIEIEVDESL